MTVHPVSPRAGGRPRSRLATLPAEHGGESGSCSWPTDACSSIRPAPPPPFRSRSRAARRRVSCFPSSGIERHGCRIPNWNRTATEVYRADPAGPLRRGSFAIRLRFTRPAHVFYRPSRSVRAGLPSERPISRIARSQPSLGRPETEEEGRALTLRDRTVPPDTDAAEKRRPDLERRLRPGTGGIRAMRGCRAPPCLSSAGKKDYGSGSAPGSEARVERRSACTATITMAESGRASTSGSITFHGAPRTVGTPKSA